MSDLKYCQGVKCHTYHTKDRLRGIKGNKHYQTRRRSSFYYLGGNACSMQCERDWFERYGEQAVNYFGRITEPKQLTADNAWNKMRDWGADSETYYTYNTLTNEQRPITSEQYRSDFTLNKITE
jgi:hypothetical protein|tara:strand:+ start:473 stop:844 length:372 start_codon:yes stop_codon:yes gene_type:complete